MSVSAQHPEFGKYLETWQAIDAAVEGSRAIKAGKTKYLPKPNDDLEAELSTSVDARYKQYIFRAMYANFTGRTLAGLKGAAFRKEAEMVLPAGLEYLEMNATGDGLPLEQVAKDAVSEVLKKGRAGLLVDYPSVEGNLTQEQVTALKLGASIALYVPDSIINWKTSNIGGRNTLTLVVLKEQYNAAEDEFTHDYKDQYRVLRLDETGYSQQLYRHEVPVTELFYPRMSNGSTFDHIPFCFVGSTNNDATCDVPPLEAIAEVNLGHYRNSADIEENSFIHGQLTLAVTSDLSAEQWKEMNPNGIVVGARAGHFLGSQGGLHSIQASPSSLTLGLMDKKEYQLVMLGAQLIIDKNSNQTAKAAQLQHASEHSVLGDVVNNVSEAIEQAIRWCGEFMGVSGDVEYDINTQFFDENVDPQMIIQAIAMYDRELITSGDLQDYGRKAGIIAADRTNDDINQGDDNERPDADILDTQSLGQAVQ